MRSEGGAASAWSFLKRIFRIPFFAFFFLLFPFLHFGAENYEKRLHFHKLIQPFGMAFCIAFGAWLFLTWIYRNSRRASMAVFLMIFLFFSYGHLYLQYLGSLPLHPRLISGFFIFLFLLVPFLVPIAAFFTKNRVGFFLTVYMNLFSVLVCFVPVTRAYFKNPKIFESSSPVLEKLPAAEKHPEPLPDIYYIVMDEYGRADILQKTFGLDIRPFEKDLKDRGFWVAEKPHSNYAMTIYSLPSSLNFEYMEPAISEGLATEKIQYARILRFLKGVGYRYVFIRSGVTMTEEAPLADQVIGYGGADDVSVTFANTTLLRAYSVFLLAESWRERHLHTFRELKKLPLQPEPKFVFAHLVIPHPPIVFKKDGSLYGGITTSFTPRSWIKTSVTRYVEGYAGQAEYLNFLLKDLVDTILRNSKTPPLIILQSDHGIDPVSEDWSEDKALYKRMANFTAIYADPEVLKKFYPEVTPVNIFRILLDHYFGTHFGMLKDEVFMTRYSPIGEVVWENVTERIKKLEEFPPV